MTTYTHTPEQHESIRAARLQLLDSPHKNDHAAAKALDWVLTAEPSETLYLALHKSGEGYVSNEKRDADHAASVRATAWFTVTSDTFRDYYPEDVEVFEIARPRKEA